MNAKRTWKEFSFLEAPFSILDGDRGKNYPKQNEFESEGHCLFLSATNVTNEGFLFNTVQFISEEKDKLLRSGKLMRDDIVMTTRGTIGNVAYYSKRISYDHMRINSGMVIFRCQHEEIIPSFLYIFLRSSYATGQMNALRSGVAQPQLPICDMKRMKITVPPLPVQRKLSIVVSSYDNLIENNNRRIQILEEMAQAIYNEWFVKFRFPGHSKVNIIDSELGKIPEGWGIVKVSDVIDIQNGYAFKSKTFDAEGDYGVITIKNVQEGRFTTQKMDKILDVPDKMPKHCRVKERDILLSLTGNVGRVCLVYGDNFLLNQRVAKLVPKFAEHKAFTYFMFYDLNFRTKLEQISTGAAQQNLSPVEMGKLNMIRPSSDVLDGYARLCNPMVEEMILLFKKNSILQKTRDILLPKLISGEVDVENLDIDIGEED